MSTITWNEVDSSAVTKVGYDQLGRLAYVEFTRGAVYVYHDVSSDEYRQVVDAESVGGAVPKVLGHKFNTEVQL